MDFLPDSGEDSRWKSGVIEYEAVAGARSIFEQREQREQRKIKAIALELHPSVLLKRGKNIAEITRFLEECGYSMSEEFLNAVWSL